jgi:hypothetical protein
MNKHG